MKITIRLIFFLVLAMTVAAVGFSFWQSRQEEFRLKNELERRANIIADSLRESVEPLLKSNSPDAMSRIVNKFSNRERLLGVSISDLGGNLLAVSTSLQPLLKEPSKMLKESIQQIEESGSEYGQFMNLDDKAHLQTVDTGGMQQHIDGFPEQFENAWHYGLNTYPCICLILYQKQ